MTRINQNHTPITTKPLQAYSQADLAKSLERFSSGLPIRKASAPTSTSPTTQDGAANQGIREANRMSAESALRDVDIAKEMTESIRKQILAQSATSISGQANSSPQRVLELLKD